MNITFQSVLASVHPFKNSWKNKARRAGLELSQGSIQSIPQSDYVRLTKDAKYEAAKVLSDVGFVWFRNVRSTIEQTVNSDKLLEAIRYFQYRTTLDLGNELRKNPDNPLTNEGEILVPNAGGTANKIHSEWAHFDSSSWRNKLMSIGYGPTRGIIKNAKLKVWNLRDSIFSGKKFIISPRSTYIRLPFLAGIRRFTIEGLNPNEHPIVVLIDGLDSLAHSSTRIVVDPNMETEDVKRPMSRVYLDPYKEGEELPCIFRYSAVGIKGTLKLNREGFLKGKPLC